MGYGNIKGTGTSTADRVAAHVARHSMCDREQCEDPPRRAKLEKDDAAWLACYCPDTFFLPFEKPHKAILTAAREAMETGRDMVVAAERGIGKSFILYGITFKFVVTGEQEFPVYIPWGEKDKAQGFNFWIDCLAHNDRIHADYPEATAPFRHAEGVSQRVRTTTWGDTAKNTGARINISKGMIVLPDALGVIGSSTMNGNPRGLNYKHPGGAAVRPTMALVDDIQDDKTAISQGDQGLVAKTIRTVNGAIRGLKRAGSDFSILMSGNCICTGDVMDHFLNQSGWDAVRVSCVERWPVGWDDPKSEARAMWDHWGELWLAKDGEAAYFRKNRAAMCKGLVLNSPKAYMHKLKDEAKDKRRKVSRPINAAHAVMREYYTMGNDAFMAERQQTPVDPISHSGPYVITTEHVKARTTDRKPLEKPEWVTTVVASSDINPSYAVSTVVLGFGVDQTCAVLWYGLRPCKISDGLPKPEFDRQIYANLAAHGKEIAATPCMPQLWAVDAGGKNFDGVMRYALDGQAQCGIITHGFRGTGWKGYREYGKTYVKNQLRREMCHIRADHKDGRRITWVPWQSDYWKEITQRAMLGDIGAPGSCSLPAGNHDVFAAQFCNEKLAGKTEAAGKVIWVYNRTPGKNDLLDAMAQGYAAAAFCGTGTGGEQAPAPKAVYFTGKPKRR